MAQVSSMKAPEEIELPPSPPLKPKNGSEPPPPLLPSPIIAFESRPQTPQRATFSESDPVPSSPGSLSTPSLHKPRNRSPVSRGHLRSHTSAGTMTLPPMQRAHSSPGVDSTGRLILPSAQHPHRPASPLGHSGRRRSPLRSAMEEIYPSGPTWVDFTSNPTSPSMQNLISQLPACCLTTASRKGRVAMVRRLQPTIPYLARGELPRVLSTIRRPRRTCQDPLSARFREVIRHY